MTCLERAMAVYQRERCARTFEEDLMLHLKYGYVLSVPTAFVMARPVNMYMEYDIITNPIFSKFSEVNAWWIYLLAGDIREVIRHIPFQLPYVGWEIDNKPRFRPLDRIRRKFNDRAGHLLLQGRGRVPTATTGAASPDTGGGQRREEPAEQPPGLREGVPVDDPHVRPGGSRIRGEIDIGGIVEQWNDRRKIYA